MTLRQPACQASAQHQLIRVCKKRPAIDRAQIVQPDKQRESARTRQTEASPSVRSRGIGCEATEQVRFAPQPRDPDDPGGEQCPSVLGRYRPRDQHQAGPSRSANRTDHMRPCENRHAVQSARPRPWSGASRGSTGPPAATSRSTFCSAYASRIHAGRPRPAHRPSS